MKRTLLVVLIVFAVGAGGYWLGLRQAPSSPTSTPTLAGVEKASFVCPMHSHIVQNHPGTCPICGMDLVATSQTSDTGNQIHVDTATQQKLGVRLARAEVVSLTHDIQTHGTRRADESKRMRITPNIHGLLTRLSVNRIGQRVKRGQHLYALSSQDALALQYEYIDITRRGIPTQKMVDDQRTRNRKALAEAQDETAREQAELASRQSEEQLQSILQPIERDRERIALRLRQIGFDDAMLATLLKTRRALTEVPVRAQQSCVVQEIMARPGMTLEPMTEILSCIDDANAWLEIVLYPDQLSWVREGDAVTVAFENGASLKTHLNNLNPLIDESSRTIRTRIPLAGNGNLGGYASVTIHTTPRQILSVPKSAVLRSGRGNYVIRALEKGHFIPVPVSTGIETTERIAIRDGLKEGDQVVVNGQFLLDAASSIADTAQRLEPVK